MKVSRKSWHYIVNSKVFEDPKGNLCGYFWQTILAIVLFIPLYIVVFPVNLLQDGDSKDTSPLFSWKVFAGLFFYLAIFLLVNMILMFFVEHESVEALGVLGWIVAVSLLITYLSSIGLFDRFKGKKEKKESLVVSYLKAKKKKVCPIIEFTEE